MDFRSRDRATRLADVAGTPIGSVPSRRARRISRDVARTPSCCCWAATCSPARPCNRCCARRCPTSRTCARRCCSWASMWNSMRTSSRSYSAARIALRRARRSARRPSTSTWRPIRWPTARFRRSSRRPACSITKCCRSPCRRLMPPVRSARRTRAPRSSRTSLRPVIYNRQRFVHHLALRDVHMLLDGGWMLAMGQEDAAAAAVRYAAPAARRAIRNSRAQGVRSALPAAGRTHAGSQQVDLHLCRERLALVACRPRSTLQTPGTCTVTPLGNRSLHGNRAGSARR